MSLTKESAEYIENDYNSEKKSVRIFADCNKSLKNQSFLKSSAEKHYTHCLMIRKEELSTYVSHINGKDNF